MTTEDVISLIGNLGTPIVMLGVVAWFCYYMFNKYNEKEETLRKEYSKSIEQFSIALNNNTIIVTKLVERMDNNDFTNDNE